MSLQIKGEWATLLEQWYTEICREQVEKAAEVRERIANKYVDYIQDSVLNELEPNQEEYSLFAYYALIRFRHEILLNDVNDETIQLIEDIRGKSENQTFSDRTLNYYYQLFNAIYATTKNQFQVAKDHFIIASQTMDLIPSEKERIEFDYRLAIYYYQTYQSFSAIKLVIKLENDIKDLTGYERIRAACDNLYGLCSNSIRQFEQAEVYFLSALDKAKKAGYERLEMKVRHNLGLLYADQGNPELAINYLSDSLKENLKTVYLLAREYQKIGLVEKAKENIKKGYELCDEEYKYHFDILQELNEPTSMKKFDYVIKAGIEYFEREELWKYVVDYVEMLAARMHDKGNIKEASRYFYKAYKAREKTEGGVLK